MDEIKFSHVIIKELFRNTSWGNVDTPFNYDFMTMKLKSHSWTKLYPRAKLRTLFIYLFWEREREKKEKKREHLQFREKKSVVSKLGYFL